MEEDIGERINDVRTDQAIEVKADTIAVGCPFCLTMMADGIKDREKEESMDALDIAEIVWNAMGLEEEVAEVVPESQPEEVAESSEPEPEVAEEAPSEEEKTGEE